MTMYFDGKFNANIDGFSFINTIDFVNKRTGKIITIDRDESDISWEDDGTFSARWKGCYIWDGHGRNYDVCAPDMAEYDICGIDYDDDFCVPDDFMVEITGYEFA